MRRDDQARRHEMQVLRNKGLGLHERRVTDGYLRRTDDLDPAEIQ